MSEILHKTIDDVSEAAKRLGDCTNGVFAFYLNEDNTFDFYEDTKDSEHAELILLCKMELFIKMRRAQLAQEFADDVSASLIGKHSASSHSSYVAQQLQQAA